MSPHSHAPGAPDSSPFGPPTVQLLRGAPAPRSDAGLPSSTQVLETARAAVRESRRWGMLFATCAAAVALWMVTGDLSVWPSLVGFTICALLALLESRHRTAEAQRIAQMVELRDVLTAPDTRH